MADQSDATVHHPCVTLDTGDSLTFRSTTPRDPTQEASGGSYARQAVSWSAASESLPIQFSYSLPATSRTFWIPLPQRPRGWQVLRHPIRWYKWCPSPVSVWPDAEDDESIGLDE